MSIGRRCRAGLVVSVLLALCPIGTVETAPASEPEALRIGIVARPGLTGDRLLAGASRAAERRNRAGGIEGRLVQLVPLAPEGTWDAVASVLGRAVFEKRLHALVGAFGGSDAHAAAQLATRARLPVITLSGEASLTEAKDPWVFRGLPRDEDQARALLQWSSTRTSGHRARIVVPEGREGRERALALRRACAEAGLEVVTTPDDPGTDEPPTDILLLWLDAPDAIDFLERRHAGSPALILGSLRLDTPELRAVAARLALPVALPRLRRQTDVATSAPGASTVAGGVDGSGCHVDAADVATAVGHDMVELLATVAARVGPLPLQIRDGLLDSDGISGCTGAFSFDSRGNRTGRLAVELLRDARPASTETRSHP